MFESDFEMKNNIFPAATVDVACASQKLLNNHLYLMAFTVMWWPSESLVW